MALEIEKQLIKAVVGLEFKTINDIQKSTNSEPYIIIIQTPIYDPGPDIFDWYKVVKSEREEIEY